MPVAVADRPISLSFGADARWDHIDTIGLYPSVAGRRTGVVREDGVDEYSGSLFLEGSAALTDRLRLTLGARGDLYGYTVDARSNPLNSGRGTDAILSPKAALAWRAGDSVELYANYGESFHSNDVRGASIRVDPLTGGTVDRVQVLVKARGSELGARIERPNFTASLVGYHLSLGSELAFVGDGGATERNDATRRIGAEATLFWRPLSWLALDAAGGITRARFRNLPAGRRRVPNSVSRVMSGGAEATLGSGMSTALRIRHFGAAPLIEDGSARSRPTTLVILGAYWRRGRAKIGLDVLNLFNAKEADITYFYASRLPGEPAEGVGDYHLHPVEPRQVRASLRLSV